MKFINSKVYEDGVTATLKKNYFIALTAIGEGGSEIIATTACIDNDTGATENYLKNKINWDKDKKSITILPFAFEETKSIIIDETVKTATDFALIELDGTIYKASENATSAYENSEALYKWPVVDDSNKIISDDNKIISGELSTQIDIAKGNNFKFRESKIVFSEGA